MEVLRLLNNVDMVDVSKAFKLHRKVCELKILSSKFEENSSNLLADEMVVDEKAFNPLVDNLGLVTECESLSADVKGEAVEVVNVSKFRYEIRELKAAKSDLEKASKTLRYGLEDPGAPNR
ncbi:hypothetical protein AgCh_005446 [Apium graveolens]